MVLVKKYLEHLKYGGIQVVNTYKKWGEEGNNCRLRGINTMCKRKRSKGEDRPKRMFGLYAQYSENCFNVFLYLFTKIFNETF